MTTLRWTLPASADFLGIIAHIKADKSAAVAAQVGRRILGAADRLAEFPSLGGPGRIRNTRETVIPGLPYLLVYSVESGSTAPCCGRPLTRKTPDQVFIASKKS